ncbi:hypothetical protein [Nocardioides caldifontis]|uniref:hypothetical protein n=1 Tax=Nocardioides caldifontis TaxID=2588938 RepID=UPI0011DF961D|nr:hypothetical protein [Nocardioides caldifontis]
MELLERHRALVGRAAWFSAWFGLVLGQLHALARFRTADGRSDLESGLVRAWAEPADDALHQLLGWADADLVYVTYGKLWLPVFVAFFLCALLVHRQRRPRGFEKGAWRVVLVAYGAACLSVVGEYWTQWSGDPNALLDTVFLVSIPVVLVTMLGSTVLGVTLLRRGVRPRASAWLLALAFPLALVVTSVTSMGNIVLPIAFAFGLLGRRMAQPVPAAPAASPAAA